MTLLEIKTQFRPSATVNQEAPCSDPLAPPVSPLQAVRTVVRSIDECALRPVARTEAGLAFQPKALLALTLYCYAHAIYGSEDMEDALRRDVAFRVLCRQEFPDAQVLRRFRRENRETLQRVLEAVLRLMSADPEKAGAAEEASRRIGLALFIDSMETTD